MLALLAAASLQAAAPAQTCQAALGPLYEGIEEAALPGRVDGASVAGRDALIALRRERGDALITIAGGNFARADLQGARLHNICFLDTDLSGADLRNAEARGIGFVRANLEGAKLGGAHLAQVLFRRANLKDVDAAGADLAGGRMDGGWDASVENLNFGRADLSGFRFDCGITIDDGCALDGEIDVRGANLTGAAINSFNRLVHFEGARIDRTEVDLTQLAALAPAEIAGPILVRGGEAVAALSAAEHRALLPHIGLAGQAAAPAFDCARAATRIERLICAPDRGDLRAIDRDIAAIYRRVGRPAVAGQAAWLRRRDACPVDQYWCVEAAYQARRAALAALAGPPAWARPGASALFVAPNISFDDAIRADPLYARLIPVIVGDAWSRAVVTVRADGTIDVSGDAVGANAHSCSLGGERLRLDPRTGYYSGPQESGPDVPMPWRTRPMPVLLLWGDRAEVFAAGRSGGGGEGEDPRFSDYASCGARAGFSEMERMPVSDAEIARIAAQFEGN